MMHPKLEVGLTVYLDPQGNAARRNENIRECVIKKVGRKYLTVGKEGTESYDMQFHIEPGTFKHLRQVTKYSSDWTLHFNKQEILDQREYFQLIAFIKESFSGGSWTMNYSLKQLRAIKHIIDSSDNFYLS